MSLATPARPGPQAVGDAQARDRAADRGGQHEPDRAALAERAGHRAGRPAPSRGTPSRTPPATASSLDARRRCPAAGRRPRSARRPAGRTVARAVGDQPRRGVRVAEVGGDRRRRGRDRRGASTASVTRSASRDEITTRAPSATRHSAVAKPKPAGGAGEDVHPIGQSEIHAPILPYAGRSRHAAGARRAGPVLAARAGLPRGRCLPRVDQGVRRRAVRTTAREEIS